MSVPHQAGQISSSLLRLSQVLRLMVYVYLLAGAYFITDGRRCHVVGAIGMTVALVLHLVQVPRFFRMSMVWQVGYIALIAREGFFTATEVIETVGQAEYDIASRYLLGASAALLAGHCLLTFEPMSAPPPRERPVWRPGLVPSALLTAIYLLVAVVLLPSTVQQFMGGRIGSDPHERVVHSASVAVLAGLALSANITLPGLVTYYVLNVQRRSFTRAVILSAPSLLLAFVGGSRFPLLMSLSGMLVVRFAPKGINSKTLLRALVLGVVGLLLNAVMVKARNTGLANWSIEEMLRPSQDEQVLHAEGIMVQMAQAVRFFTYREHMHGASTGGIFLFWIPRALWPDKPTLIGYWFPREYGGEDGFSKGHSAALSFASDPFFDFGFTGGIVFCLIAGLVFGLIERRCARIIADPSNPLAVSASVLFGATFFAVRSADTTFITMSGTVLLNLVFLAALRIYRVQAAATGPQSLRPQAPRPPVAVARSAVARPPDTAE